MCLCTCISWGTHCFHFLAIVKRSAVSSESRWLPPTDFISLGHNSGIIGSHSRSIFNFSSNVYIDFPNSCTVPLTVGKGSLFSAPVPALYLLLFWDIRSHLFSGWPQIHRVAQADLELLTLLCSLLGRHHYPSLSLLITILTRTRRCLQVILIFIYLMIGDAEHSFHILIRIYMYFLRNDYLDVLPM